MDSFEVNKIVGALLGTLIFVMAFGFVAQAVYDPIENRGVGYALREADGAAGAAGPVAAAVEPIAVRLTVADAAAGHAALRKCESCHTFNEGGANKAGPNLYDIVDRLVGGHDGFSYSAGMLDHKEKGDLWTYENLDAFLHRPKGFTPGTKMTFSGVNNAQERANMLAYMQTLSAAPKPFPTPEQVAESETPEEGETAVPIAGTPAGADEPAGAEAPARPADEPADETAGAPAPAVPPAQ